MPTTTIPAPVAQAVAILNRSDRGREVMRALLAMLDDGGISLDQSGQWATLTLLAAAYERPGRTRDAMRDALDELPRR